MKQRSESLAVLVRPFFPAFAAAVLVAAASARAAEKLPLIRKMPMEVVYRAPADIKIPTEETPARVTLKLPSFPFRRNGLLCLRFEACLKRPAPAGWNPYLGVIVNGEALGPDTKFGFRRLLKRGQFAETTIGPQNWWGHRGGLPVLLTFFGPGGDVLDKRVTKEREEGYWYLLDITDAAHCIRRGADNRIESEEPNAITFVNTCIARYVRKARTRPVMTLSHLEIGYLPPALADALHEGQLERFQPIASGPTLRGEGFSVRVAESGGMELDVNGERYFIRSAFSYPGKTEAGRNTLHPNRAEGQPGWKPTVRREGDAVVVEAAGAQYRITRRIRLDGPRVRVADTIENRLDEPVGLAVENTLALGRMPAPGRWRVAGTDRFAQIGGCAANPTLFAAQARSSVGVVAEDDVFRLQLELLRRGNAFDFRTTHFGLDRRKSYTLEWTLYPSARRGYFDFVNQVRRDWGVNYTIEGPFVFDGVIRRGRKARIYVFGPWLDYHHDGSLTRARYRARVEPTLRRLKAEQPDGVFMPKIETNLFTIVKTRLPGGDALPGSDRKTGRYGFILTKEQTLVLERGLGPWADSILRTQDGRIVIDTYYEGYHRNKAELFNLLLRVRVGNHRYRVFFDQIDFVMDRIGFNGVYIDQFATEGNFSRRDRFTWEEWDGHTVDLDPSGRLAGRRTDCNLAGAAARAKILRRILAKGGKVVINGQSTVRETRGLPVFRFQEMDNDGVNPLRFLHGKPPIYYWQARGHLGSPIILGLRPVRFGEEGKRHWAEVITKGVITGLRNGVLYYYYTSTIPSSGPGAGEYGPVNHMFPFTPVELHEGWLVGKERVIACVSGAYDWPHAARPQCHLFDLRGRERPSDFRVTRAGAGWKVQVKLDDWNAIAVIE